MCSLCSLLSLLLLGGWSSGLWCGFFLSSVVLGDRKSLSVSAELPEGVSGLTTDVSVAMVGHVGSWLAVRGLHLQLLDLSGLFDVVVLEGGLGLGDMLVLDFFGSSLVVLLLSLSLSSLEVDQSGDDLLECESGLVDGELVVEEGSACHESVDGVVDLFFDLVSTK